MYFQYKEKGAFRVLTDGYVTQDSGVGIVHQAPYFGADDFRSVYKHIILLQFTCFLFL